MKQKFHTEIVLLGIVSIISLASFLGAHSFEASATINTINGDGTADQKILRQAGNTTVTNSTGKVTIGIGPNVAVLNKSQNYTAGAKQTFGPSSTSAGVNLGVLAGNPNSVKQGDLWYNSGLNVLGYGGTGNRVYQLVTTNVTQTISFKKFVDNVDGFISASDITKQILFSVSNVPTGHTYTWTFPNANSTFVGTDITQTITGPTTMNSLILGGAENANSKKITSLGTPTSATDAVNAKNLGLLGNMTFGHKCSDQQIIKYQLSNQTWICAADLGLAAAITSINSDSTAAQTLQGSSGNVTVTNSGATHTWNLGNNAVITGGAAQTISKQMTFSTNVNMGGNITSTAASGHTFKISVPANVAICIGTGC